MGSLVNANRVLLQRIRPLLTRRLVSTSKKNNDTVAADVCKAPAKSEPKNWISYGFDFNSKANDRNALHSLTFATITLCVVVGGFVFGYAPDYNLLNWATREAFLELRRRENAGLPLVDPNLISPEKIILPSDEELGDTEIII